VTRVCFVGASDVDVQYELLSRETARGALSTYERHAPFENSLAVDTVSLGAAVSLCNDLNWYLVRFVDEALVLESSVSDEEWLSRDLASDLREDRVTPDESDRFLKVYGVVTPDKGDAAGGDEGDTAADDGNDGTRRGPDRRLVDPMFVTRTGPELPDYDLRDVDETVVVRVTEGEFGA